MPRIENVVVEQLNTGDHIAAERDCSEISPFLCPLLSGTDGKYRHHGIFYCGSLGAMVIEFGAETGNKDNARFQVRSIEEFLGNSPQLYRVVHENYLSVEETLKLAEKALKLGRPRYNLLFNNCETFATYLKTGVGHSQQVSSAFKWNLFILLIFFGSAAVIIYLIHSRRK